MSQHRNHSLILSALSLATGLMLTAGAGWSPVLAQPKSIEAGYDFLERGWVDDAIREFQRAVQQQPESVSAQLGLAIAYERAGQDANAWQAYQKVLDLEPQNRRALTAVGTLGGYRPEWQVGGIQALTTLLTLEPQINEARAQRALLLGYQGRFVEAIADYEILLDRNPPPPTVVAAAQIYTYSGDFSRGLALFERYLQTGEPLTEAAAIAYAQTLSRAGRADEAVAVLNQRLRAGSDSIELRAAIAAAYSRNGQTDQALAVLAPLRNDPDAVLPLARALSAIGREAEQPALYREAIALYQQALANTRQPSDGFLIEVADVLSEDPAYQADALQLYDAVLARLPGEPALVTKRMITAYELGEISEAALNQELLALLQPLPTGTATQQQIGQALLRLGNPDPTLLPIYTDLIAVGTPVDFLYFRLAQVQIARENWTAAREAIAAYRSTPTSREDFAPDLLLADLERRQGNFDVSAQQYEAIFDQADSLRIKEAALLGLGGLRQSQRQWEAALIAYERLLELQPASDRAQLGVTYLALKLQQATPAQAQTVLDTWLADDPTLSAATVTPELLDLVGELPPDPSRFALYEELLAVAPTHLGLNRRYAQTLAMTDPEAAILYLEAIAPDDPAETDFYFVQGEVAQTLGELELASAAYETILVQEPDNVDALAALGGVRFQQRRLAAAEILYEEVLVLRPNDWDTRRILAELQLAQDEPIAAIQQFAELAA
ncbi:MAG: tetratricopeptide repeat protein, partial [Cyanobacteria bacterium P01_H01_bin.153]